MVGIRIRHLPEDSLEKALKIYFSKPEHGGGKIQKIYFPLMNNDAVIMFEDPRVIQSITQFQHKMAGKDLEIEILPEHMIFTIMEAKVDMNASVILQVSQKLRDEMEFGENIRITLNEDQTYSLKGNWFQLEWAWNYLSCYMKHQEVIQSQIEQTSNSQHNHVAMETETTGSMVTSAMDDEAKWRTYRVRPSSPTDVNSSLRKTIADRNNQQEENLRLSRSPRLPPRDETITTSSIHSNSNKRSSGQEFDESRSRHKDETQQYHKSIGSPHESLRETGSPHSSIHQSSNPQLAEAARSDRSSHKPSLTGLKDNISQSYGGGRGNYSSMFRPDPDDYDTEDELELHGKEHLVPFESVHSSLGIGNQDRKTDQNDTFEQYSAMTSNLSRHQNQSQQNIQKSFRDTKDPISPKSNKGRSLVDKIGAERSNHNNTGKASASVAPMLNDQLNLGRDKSLRAETGYGAAASSSRFESMQTAGSSMGSHGASSSLHRSKLPDKYSEDQLQCQFPIRQMMVTVYYGDLLQETAEGIINAANCDLDHMGGVAYAISKARGPEMERECREYIRRNGNLKVSECTHTSGGGSLKSLHVIHAYGPMWLGEESKEKSSNQLRDTFLNCFTYAENKLWIRSLCTPAISTGVFGVPLDICVRGFLDGILIFTDKYPESRLTDIRLVSNDAESTVTSIVLLQTLLDTGIDHLTTEAVESYKQFTEKSRMNLPRGRPENVDLMKSYHSSRAEIASNIVNRRRSSSTSRVADKKRHEDSSQRVSGYESPAVSRRDKDYRSDKTEERGRIRTQSSVERMSRTRYDSSNSNMAAAPTRPHTAADMYNKGAAPRIKQSLLTNPTSSRLNLKHTVKSTVSSKLSTRPKTTALAARDDYRTSAARDEYRTSVSPSSDVSDDAYMTGLTRRNYPDPGDDEFGLQSLPVNLGHDSSFREKFLQMNSEEKQEKKVNICAICLDKVKHPKTLSKCGHIFCTNCIDSYFSVSQPKCPTCGMLYGQLKGDQPRGGSMTSSTDRKLKIPGYEHEDGAIVINYTFPGGIQESNHPRPGRSYKGFNRKAYLPNSIEGREVLRLLKRAFQAKLTFTIGESRTTGESGVITWNDIHHKTNVTGGSTKFGYPDPTYLKRVKEELASKGIV